MRSLDIDHLKTFLALAATEGFGRAAQRVNKTQAAVSVQMKRLEETVGCRLIDRQARRSLLTPEGQRLRNYAEKIVRLNDQAMIDLGAPDVAGVVRLGTPLYMQNFFPEILARFASTHPNVEVEILSEPSAQMLAAVNAGALDLAVITHRSGGSAGEVVRHEPLYWVCAPGCDTHRSPVVPLALYHPTSALRTMATEALESIGRAYRIAYSSPSTEALLAAVGSGLAIAVLPRCSIGPSYAVLTPKHGFPALPVCDISLVFAPGGSGPVARALGRHLEECLKEYDVHSGPPATMPQ